MNRMLVTLLICLILSFMPSIICAQDTDPDPVAPDRSVAIVEQSASNPALIFGVVLLGIAGVGGGVFYGVYMTQKGRRGRKKTTTTSKAVRSSQPRDTEDADATEFSHKQHVIRQTALLELIQVDLRYIVTALRISVSISVTLFLIWILFQCFFWLIDKMM
jgi:hypothetical protein